MGTQEISLTEHQRHWLAHLRACEASGKGIAGYAAAHGLYAKAMYAGKKVLVKKGVPVYDVPDGLGLIQKIRNKKEWTGFCWVSPGTVSDMLLLLPHVRPLYISIHERKVGRTRWINGLSLQMSHPAFLIESAPSTDNSRSGLSRIADSVVSGACSMYLCIQS
jgi:hypothetical protein